ncbi:MAG: hypothetical protein WCL21_14640 [Mariniphaga sp.]
MNKTLYEVYLKRTDNPALVELARKSVKYPDEWDSQYKYFYYLYYDTPQGPKFILAQRSTSPFHKLKVSLKSRIEALVDYTHESLCFLIVQFYLETHLEGGMLNIPNPSIQGKVLPVEVQKIIEETNGYLVYKDQLAAFYRLATGCDDQTAIKWVKDFNKKLTSVLESVADLTLNGEPMTYFHDLFATDEGGHLVLHKPVEVADDLMEYLES